MIFAGLVWRTARPAVGDDAEELALIKALYGIKRWIYPAGRPGWIAAGLNAVNERMYSAGRLSPGRAVTLVVAGRRTGRQVRVPVVVADWQGQRYLVSMLGADASWVANVRAASGRAALSRKGQTPVLLTSLPTGQRAPVIRRYLQLAPGARPHIPVDRRAPIADFEAIASQYPVFRIDPAEALAG